MNAAATQFDTAGWTIAQWQAAYLAGARPEALLAGHAAPDAPPTMPGSCGSTVRRWRASWTNWRGCWRRRTGPVAPAAVWRALRGRTTSTSRAGRPPPPAPRSPRPTRMPACAVRAAGAILIGKTNLDQFATGLVGTRSPHGAVANAFRPEYISGGSSSGSASVVARGLAVFSLGTDTAGSGRAGGLQQHRRTQAHARLAQRRRRGAGLPHAGLRVGVRPDGRRRLARGRHRRRLRRARSLRGPCRPARPSCRRAAFRGAGQAGVPRRRRGRGRLRRGAARCEPPAPSCGPLISRPMPSWPRCCTRGRGWPSGSRRSKPCGASSRRDRPGGARHRRRGQALQRAGCLPGRIPPRRWRAIQQSLADVDALLVPTAPSIYTIAQLREDPLALNSRLGRYTNSPIWPTCARWPCRRARRRPARRHHRAGPGLAGPCAGRIRQALAGAPGPAAGRHRQAAARRAGVA